MLRQYNIVFTCSTLAESASEAVWIAADQVRDGSAHVEVEELDIRGAGRMRHIAVWHCYWYGPNETYVMLAETEDALRAKVRGEIAAGWYAEDQGPMPEDFDELVEVYEETNPDNCYFGDWGWTVIDSTLCQPVGDE